MSCSIEQLQSILKQLEAEIEQLTRNFAELKQAMVRFSDSRSAVTQLAVPKAESEILVPLTTSMYVPGTIASREKVLVEVGTGFFVEKSVQHAQEFFDRKVKFLTTNTQKVEEQINAKRRNYEMVQNVAQQRVRFLQQQQLAAAAAEKGA